MQSASKKKCTHHQTVTIVDWLIECSTLWVTSFWNVFKNIDLPTFFTGVIVLVWSAIVCGVCG